MNSNERRREGFYGNIGEILFGLDKDGWENLTRQGTPFTTSSVGLKDFLSGLQNACNHKPKTIVITHYANQGITTTTISNIVHSAESKYTMTYANKDGEVIFSINRDSFICSKTTHIDGVALDEPTE